MHRTWALGLLLLFAWLLPAAPTRVGGPAFLPQLVSVPPGAQRIEAGDFDGDGDMDLALLSSLPNQARAVILDNRPGGFVASWSLVYPPALGGRPVDLEIGDLDGDLDLDILVNVPYAAAEARFNAGDGTFPTAGTIGLAGQRLDNELADLDGDGDLDIGFYELDLIGYLATARNQGDGTFTNFPDSALRGFQPGLRSSIGEVTGDALPDFLLSSADGLQLAPGTVFGSFAGWGSPLPLATGQFAEVAIADLDGDPAGDAVAASPSAGGVAVLLGLPGGGLGAPTFLPTGPRPEALVVTDVGCGPAPDIVVVDRRRGILSVLVGNGDGTFQEPAEFFVGRQPSGVTSGDFDGDGDEDLAVCSAKRVVLLLNQETP